MSLSTLSEPARLSDRLSTAKIRELAALILKSEHPRPSRALVDPLLELVSPVDVLDEQFHPLLHECEQGSCGDASAQYALQIDFNIIVIITHKLILA